MTFFCACVSRSQRRPRNNIPGIALQRHSRSEAPRRQPPNLKLPWGLASALCVLGNSRRMDTRGNGGRDGSAGSAPTTWEHSPTADKQRRRGAWYIGFFGRRSKRAAGYSDGVFRAGEERSRGSTGRVRFHKATRTRRISAATESEARKAGGHSDGCGRRQRHKPPSRWSAGSNSVAERPDGVVRAEGRSRRSAGNGIVDCRHGAAQGYPARIPHMTSGVSTATAARRESRTPRRRASRAGQAGPPERWPRDRKSPTQGSTRWPPPDRGGDVQRGRCASRRPHRSRRNQERRRRGTKTIIPRRRRKSHRKAAPAEAMRVAVSRRGPEEKARVPRDGPMGLG